MLKEAGVFAAFGKTELLNGELSGVPLKNEDGTEWLSDASIPIKLRVRDYALLADAGAFDHLGNTELVDGIVYGMSPQYRTHGYARDQLAYRIRRVLENMGSPLHVATEQSVDVAEHNEPLPDIILTTEPRGEGAIPGASVALLVEVSVSTRTFDLGDKAASYAAADIPEYWVVDVRAKTLHILWSPGADGYRERREVAFGERAESATMAGLAVATEELV